MSERPDASRKTGELAAPAFLVDTPTTDLRQGRYRIHFVRDAEQLDEALRLRYEVFNLELGEGLTASHVTGRDEDVFDQACHHLLVTDTRSGRVIGTYRMQTGAMAAAHHGFYSAGEFDLSGLAPVLADSVEIGRACIHKDHRKQKVLFALWMGLAAYLVHSGRRYLFGCCSLTSQDPGEGRATMEALRRDGHVHAQYRAPALPALRCEAPEPTPAAVRAVKLPTLFGTYLRFGARVVGGPALDREFQTIDYLVLMDTATLPARTRATFFGRLPA